MRKDHLLFSLRSRTSSESRRVSRFDYETLEPRQLLAAVVENPQDYQVAELLSSVQQSTFTQETLADSSATAITAVATSSTIWAVASGNWDSGSTWQGGVVPSASSRAVIPQNVTVNLNGANTTVGELVIQGVLNVTETSGADKRLTSAWVHVNSGGVFQIGSAANRYDNNDFILTLTGDDPTETFQVDIVDQAGNAGALTITNNNGFLMAHSGGRLQFFGQEKIAFTKLAQTANVGSNQILVERQIDRDFDGDLDSVDGTLDWQVGDQIVIASSSEDYDDEEIRTITAITNQPNNRALITFSGNLRNRHYGEIETYSDPDDSTRTWDLDLRAEVALLSRNVRVEGEARHDTDNSFGDRARFTQTLGNEGDGFGGHIMIMGSAGQITIDGVQLDKLGQTARVGRYPIHWHLAGDRSGDVLRRTSITNSNNRGVTIHGTHNVLLQDVVLHDIHGHGFFMEDGVETGNRYLSNIAFGIHKVGRSAAVGDFAPDLNDPFIVDTHDHVGQNANRFLSSAAYWITNPDNTWIGNISAGSEGTGFWFIFPGEAIGASANDPQYANVRPDRTNLRQFDFNGSHSSPAGLNFDRGSDLEVPVGGNIKAFFDGDNWFPTVEPQINSFTAYKHNVGIYHRGFTTNFNDSRLADNNIGTFITFTQRITDSLYVGHSRGNADFSDSVTGHTIYDGANTLDGLHFAGFAANNAHMFRVNGSALRHTSHVTRNTSFENDGSAGHVSIGSQGGGSSHGSPFNNSSAAIYDEDGTFTGHVGGGAGSTIVTNHPFYYDADDFRPAGWNAVVSDDLYSMLYFVPNNGNARFRVTSPDGDSIVDEGRSRKTHIKNGDAQNPNDDYLIELSSGSLSDTFNFRHWTRTGPSGSTVLRFVNFGDTLRPRNMNRARTLAELRSATQTTFTVVNGDVYIKAFNSSRDILMRSFNNTTPNANNDLASTDAGSSVTIDVLSNDSDLDGDSLTVTPTSTATVVADYRDDFTTQNGTPAAGWQYLWNESGTFGNANNYSVMEAVGNSYRPQNQVQQFLNLSATFGHPGPGTDNSNTVGYDLFAIAAYTVAADGVYSIDDSFISRAGQFSDGVEVVLHVGNDITQIASIAPQGSGNFNRSLGFLPANTTIYIGVGPDGPGSGSSAGQDSFTWDFSITRQNTNGNGQLIVNPDQTVTYIPDAGFSGTDTFSYRLSDNRGRSDTASISVTVNPVLASTVEGRHVFYAGSSFDSGTTRNAIATDKSALLPGQTATVNNYTSYSGGINGIIVDVANFNGTPTRSDFEFRVGNDNSPASWTALDSNSGDVSFTAGAGAGGSDQITITWDADSAIKKQWLEITILANGTTGLSTPDVFYFGNAIGETGSSATSAAVNIFDLLGVQDNPHNNSNPANIENKYDINRDGRVNIRDLLFIQDNGTNNSNDLNLISVPVTGSRVAVVAPATSAVQSTAVDAAQTDNPATDSAIADRASYPIPEPVIRHAVSEGGLVKSLQIPSNENERQPTAVDAAQTSDTATNPATVDRASYPTPEPVIHHAVSEAVPVKSLQISSNENERQPTAVDAVHTSDTASNPATVDRASYPTPEPVIRHAVSEAVPVKSLQTPSNENERQPTAVDAVHTSDAATNPATVDRASYPIPEPVLRRAVSETVPVESLQIPSNRNASRFVSPLVTGVRIQPNNRFPDRTEANPKALRLLGAQTTEPIALLQLDRVFADRYDDDGTPEHFTESTIEPLFLTTSSQSDRFE